MAFWNRWTLGLDLGLGKRWTLDRYCDPKTQKNISLWTRLGTLDSSDKSTQVPKNGTWSNMSFLGYGTGGLVA